MKRLKEDVFLPKFTSVLEELVSDEEREILSYEVFPVMIPVQGDAIVGMSFFLLRPAIAFNDNISVPGVVPDPFVPAENIKRIVRDTLDELRSQYARLVSSANSGGKS
jgi:hypothetical protein